MDTNNPGAESEPSRWGYAGAILVSALSHAVLAALLLVVLPSYLSAPHSEPPAYTVKIVDDIPAGDLGTHLPRLSHRARPKEAEPKPPPPAPKQEPVVTKPPPPPPPPPENDKNAIALNSIKPTVSIESPTPTPHPKPTPAPLMTPAPHPTRTEAPKPRPTPKPHEARRPPTPRPTPKSPERSQKPPRSKPSAAVAIARVESTPSVKQQMNELRSRLLAEHLAREKTAPKETPAESDEGDEDDEAPESSGGGPVVAKEATEGAGAGIGSGNGSMGIQQDLDFLLYYRTVQQRIKQAWSFSGGNNDLSTQVAFAIGPDGKLTEVKITRSSHDTAFDESVLRAIRRAAPFPAPPDKYRDQFARGIEAVFRLGELNS